MLNKATTLKGYTLHGLDGEIGKVKEFYFDDQHWAIRYLVADTGNWLTGRHVLISPHALVAVNTDKQQIDIALTKKQIEDSPSLESDKPVSRQFEKAYHGYFGWPAYWNGPRMWGAGYYPFVMDDEGPGTASTQGVSQYGLGGSSANQAAWNTQPAGDSSYGLEASPALAQNPESSGIPAEDDHSSDPHLRSMHDVSGHHIHADDGEIGHVEDFVIDDKTWAIRYLIIDTRNWWPGKTVLISPTWIARVSWDEKAVFVNLSCEAIKQSPEYTEDAALTRDYETNLHTHYNRPGYWVDAP